MFARRKIRNVTSLEVEDLVAEGNQGLLRAIELYDPTKARFSTYCGLWIRGVMNRAIDKSRLVHVPSNRLHDEQAQVFSIDSFNQDEEDNGIDLTDHRAHDSLESMVEQEQSETDRDLAHLLLDEELDPLEAKVMKDRLGFNGDEKPLQEIGNKLGLSRERIRKIALSASSKLGIMSTKVRKPRRKNRVNQEIVKVIITHDCDQCDFKAKTTKGLVAHRRKHEKKIAPKASAVASVASDSGYSLGEALRTIATIRELLVKHQPHDRKTILEHVLAS